MKTCKRLFEEVSDFTRLYEAFIEARCGKRHKTDVQRFEYHLEERLVDIKEELEQERYRWGEYHSFKEQQERIEQLEKAIDL